MKLRTYGALLAACIAVAPAVASAGTTPGDYCLFEGGPHSINVWDVGRGFGMPPAPGTCKPWLGTEPPNPANGHSNVVETGTGCTSSDGTTFTLGFTSLYHGSAYPGTSYTSVTLSLPEQQGYYFASTWGDHSPGVVLGAPCTLPIY